MRRKVLRQTDEEIIEIDEQIEDEINKGILPDPDAPIDPATGQPMDTVQAVTTAAIQDPEIDGSSTEAPEK